MANLLSLNTSVFNPLPAIQDSVTGTLPTLAVTPTPEDIARPSTQNNFSNKAPDTKKLTRTRGLYVTNSTTSQRLIDYTEELDGKTLIYSIDDDRDGDQDVYYSLGKVIYRKENHKKSPKKYYISDAPKVYDIDDIYRDFFGLLVRNIAAIPGDAQVNILRSHTYSRVNYQFLTRNTDTHERLLLFKSLFQRKSEDASHIVDIIPEDDKGPFATHTLLSVPYVIATEGRTSIQHNKLYRTLLVNEKFRDADGKIQPLSADFVIRADQSGYAPETTVVETNNNGRIARYTLRRGQKIVFAQDSNVRILKGSLMLFSTVSEKRNLTIQDIGLPLLPQDEIFTGDTGAMTIQFPDGTQTQLKKNQHWLFHEYEPSVGIKNNSFPIEAGWWYTSTEDAHSLPESRLPQQTLFNAYSRTDSGATVAQIPREISLVLDRPTEVNFQKYFPADTVTAVEVLKLPSSEWRRINNTTIAFEMQKEKREILLRITTNSSVRDYKTTLVTRPPTL